MNLNPCEIRVSFELPEWFPPSRFDYVKQFRYSPGHIWAGQIDREESHNHALDRLFDLPDMSEYEGGYCGKFAIFRCDAPEDYNAKIQQWQKALSSLLRRYKEGREEKS